MACPVETRPLASIAIVDSAEDQYLYPGSCCSSGCSSGIGCPVIADRPRSRWRDGALIGTATWLSTWSATGGPTTPGPKPPAPHCAEAYLQHRVVLTPHPAGHALYADQAPPRAVQRRHAVARRWAFEATQQVLLAHVPRTREVVDAADARSACQWRRAPRPVLQTGGRLHGSRAAYRGDKTDEAGHSRNILAGDYVAQAIVAPGERMVNDPTIAEAARR